MRVLFLTHSFNSLAQRLFVELTERGHEVSVELDVNDAVTEQAVALFNPELVLAPFLKRALPESVWRRRLCLIVHPGPPGDRGPAALDWAIMSGARHWGVTVLQAEAEMDAGPVWASARFAMRPATKSSLYRNEATEAALAAVLEAVRKIEAGAAPERLPPDSQIWRPAMPQSERAIDWARDAVDTVLRKIRAADGAPGVRARLAGRDLFLHDARPAPRDLEGAPGSLCARCGPALAVAAADGAVWIGRLRDPAAEHPFKRPATDVLAAAAQELPEHPAAAAAGYQEIRYERRGPVGHLHFEFLNGAMSTERCQRLLAAYRAALGDPTRALVLTGGHDFWSNGMDLNAIEAAGSPADESWRNINAIDDLAETILRTDDRLTIAALQGDAGAGGVFLARACDQVWLRDGVVLNPHYKDMGNLYGSEFWSYTLPTFVGPERAAAIAAARLPMGAPEAVRIGLAEARLPGPRERFLTEVAERAARLAETGFDDALAAKRARRARAEAEKPLAAYRAEELGRMRLNFYGFDPSYHVARYNFVAKVPKSRTPLTIARHRDARRTPSETLPWRSPA